LRHNNFLSDITEIEQDIFNTVHSFILVIFEESDFYMLSGGYGHFNMSQIVDYRFGLDILERLYSDSHAMIVSLQNRRVTGNKIGENVFYRGLTSIGAENDPNMIVNRSIFQIDKGSLAEILGATVDRHYNVTASAGLKITKSFEFSEFENLVRGVHKLLKQPKLMTLSKMKPISDEDLIKGFDGKLAEHLMGILKGDTDGSEVAFTNRDVSGYLNANQREVKQVYLEIIEKGDPDIKFVTILEKLHEKRGLDRGNILAEISRVKVRSYVGEDNVYLTHPQLYDHISLECEYNGIKAFLLESEWYEYDDELIGLLHDEIETKCANLVKDDILSKSWALSTGTQDEEAYSLSYEHEKDHFVLDRVLHNNIELCDLLIKGDDENIYFIHIKKGFLAPIRELGSQVVNGANVVSSWVGKPSEKILEDMESFYGKISNKYRKRNEDLSNKLSFESFKSLFADRRKIVICLAYSDKFIGTSEDKGFIENLKEYKSTIAKMTVLETFKSINELGLEFRIVRIREV